MKSPKVSSIQSVFWRSIFLSQICLILFGFIVSFLIIPNAQERQFQSQLDIVSDQTKWAISKNVSYGAYNLVEDYLSRITKNGNVVSAILLDQNKNCVSASIRTEKEPVEGCEDSLLIEKTLAESKLLNRTIPFYHAVSGRSSAEELQAQLILVADSAPLRKAQRTTLLFSAVIFMFLIAMSLLITLHNFNAFSTELEELSQTVFSLLRGKKNLSLDKKLRFAESVRVKHAVEEVRVELNRLSEKEIETAKHAAANEIAEQVSHDIKSPLAALSVIAGDPEIATTKNGSVLSSTVLRIRSIVKDLNSLKHQQTKLDCFDLTSIAGGILSEKKHQFQENSDIVWEARFPKKNAFGIGSKETFKRILSNVLNNAAEAIKGNGRVTLSVGSEGENSVVTIQDSGRGMSRQVLERIGTRGATFGKKHGSGLGLYHAKKHVEEWGGKLLISSEPDVGTTVKIMLRSKSIKAETVSTVFENPREHNTIT